MIRTPLLAALTLLVAAPSLPQSAARPVPVAEARAYRPIETIRWTYDDESYPGGSSRQLRFKHDKSNSSVDLRRRSRMCGKSSTPSHMPRPARPSRSTCPGKPAGSLARAMPQETARAAAHVASTRTTALPPGSPAAASRPMTATTCWR